MIDSGWRADSLEEANALREAKPSAGVIAESKNVPAPENEFNALMDDSDNENEEEAPPAVALPADRPIGKGPWSGEGPEGSTYTISKSKKQLICKVKPRTGRPWVSLSLPKNFIPVPTSKGVSTTRFVLDTKLGPFYVPCHLLRVGKIQLKRHEPQEVARRSQRIASSAPAPVPIFEISAVSSAEKKHEIIVQCRAFT